MKYKIIRCYQAPNTRSRLIKKGLTLEQAQAHCSDPNTRGVTKIGGVTTRYFDAYDED